MKTFVIGDVHGAYKALLQCLERSKFDKENDTLISLGDIADGWSETPQCVDELLSIKNLIAIRGNHDMWCRNWLTYGEAQRVWVQQGGQATIDAYIATKKLTEETHKKFFEKQHHYYIDDENRGFVHGGFVSRKGIGHDPYQSNYFWDRDLWSLALAAQRDGEENHTESELRFNKHKEIFIGHTTTCNWTYDKHNIPAPEEHKIGDPVVTPINACNVWNLDTGAGYEGKLTIMDIDTKEYWQSDYVNTLYPNERGRN